MSNITNPNRMNDGHPVEGEVDRGMRLLAFAPGQTWSGWALIEGENLVTSGIALPETYLQKETDAPYLAQLDLLNQRLLGLRRAVSDLVTRSAPIDYFVCWNPAASVSLSYGVRAGQYIGLMKSVCYEHRIRLIEASDDDARRFLGISDGAERSEVERAVMERLGDVTLPTHEGTYDSGVSFTAMPIDAIAVGWTAQARLNAQTM